MKSVLTKISAIKRNPNNPRILKDDKFVKLTQSIKDKSSLSNVWRVPKELELKELHPTVKPIAIIEPALSVTTDSGKIVLDLFLGSGSTLIAAENKNRKCYGMELDPKYVDVIIKRWQDYTGKKAIHAESGDEFVEVDNGKI